LLNLSLTYFYTRRQEIIAAGFVPFSNTSGAAFFQSNMPGGLARGLEASGQLSLATQTDLRISYLYVNSEQQLRGVRSNNQPFNGSTRALGIPRNTFSATINQRYRKFNFNFDLTTVSDYDNLVFTPAELFTGFASPIFRFDGYIKADLAITYTLRRNDRYTLEIFGKGINLTNDEFFEDGFRTPGALGTGGIKIRF
jgi:hypothetical protein